MKNTVKRFLAWMLMLAMVCTMMPVSALAAMADASLNKPIVQEETVTVINPLYADVITEADLVQPSGNTTIDPKDVSEDEYADTYEGAAAQLREGMKLRQETVEVYYRTENHDFNTDGPAIWEGSFTHTGVPTEGDYLKWVWAGCSYGSSGYVSGDVYYMTYTFTLTYHSTAEQEAELDTAVEDLLSDLNPTGTDYQKLKTVYDYICANITYDYDSEGMLKHTAYAALVNKTAVCQGYAVLLYRLALEMGIDNRLVSGTGNGGDHGWNIVELNDVYYNVDSTWDATWMQQVGYYNYFLQCEDTFTEGGTDHIRGEEYDTAEFHAAYPMSETDFDPETDDVVSNVVDSGTCGDSATWVLTDDGVLTISGTGEISDYTGADTPWADYSTQLTAIVVEEGITGIGNYTFWMTTAVSISLPDTLTSIGDYSICWNPNLTEIIIPESVTTVGVFGLAQNFSLTALNIPASVTSIADGAFWGNTDLEALTVAEGNANYRVENGVLYGITSGMDESGNMDWDDTVLHTYIPGNTATEYVIPDTVQRVAAYAFYNDNLAKVTIPARVAEIGSSALSSTSVTEIVFQGSVPTMAEDSLGGVTAIAYYPAGNTTWTDEAVQNCGGTLTLTAYGDENLVAYGTCGDNALWEVTSDEVLTISGYGSMDDYLGAMISPWVLLSEEFTSIVVAEGITDIGDFSFAWLADVKTITLPSTLRTIGAAAFWGVGLNIEDEQSALRIPAGVTEIAGTAFSSCEIVNEVWFEGNAPAADGVLFGSGMTAFYPAGNDTWTEEAKAAICAEGATWTAWGDADLIAYGVCGENAAWTLTVDGALTVSGEGAMYDYNFLNGVTVPWMNHYLEVSAIAVEPGITHVGQDAFFFGFGGSTTAEIVLNEGLKSIGVRGFCGSAYLEEVTLPASIGLIGDQAFDVCPELTKVTFAGDAPECSGNIFDNNSAITVYYQANNTTWTEEVRASYNGTITWVALYEVLEDSGDTVVSGEELSIHVDADVSEFVDVYVDGELVDESNYTVTEGSTIITFIPEYLATLSEGEHEVQMNFTSGSAFASITVEPGASVTYTSASISLAGDIGVNYYAELSESVIADEGAYMEFTVAGQTQIIPVSEAELQSNGSYKFTCAVAAKQMTDTIVGQIYLSDGTPVGIAKEYSVKAYCDAAIGAYGQYEAYADLVTLMEAMLNYGAYSQVQFGYNTDNLANADLEDTTLPDLTEDAVAAYAHGAEGSEDGVSVDGVSLLLESTTTIRFYFNVEEGYDISSYTFYVDGVETTPVQSGDQYYVDKTNVAAKELDEMATVIVGGLTVQYCGLSYTRQVAVLYPTYYSEALVNVAKALYAYNMAANVYFG